jgi:hypothetical protein
MAPVSASLPAPSESPDPDARRRPPWRRLLWTWFAFWVLLFVLGAQEYLWQGGRQFWRPLADYGTSALLSTALAVLQIRRARRFDHLLGQPGRWFLHMWAWMPLQLVAFVAATDLTRFVLYSLAGQRYQPGWRFDVLT